MDWVVAVVDEIAGCVNNFYGNPDAVAAMIDALAVVPEDQRRPLLLILQSHLGDITSIVSQVNAVRACSSLTAPSTAVCRPSCIM
jgi:hypothetical protein